MLTCPAVHLRIRFPRGGELSGNPAFEWSAAKLSIAGNARELQIVIAYLLEADEDGHHNEERRRVEVGEAIDEIVILAVV